MIEPLAGGTGCPPTTAATSSSKPTTRSSAAATKAHRHFLATKLFLGVIMVLIVAWNVELTYIQLSPVQIVNDWTHTGLLDKGAFWLLATTPRAVDVGAVVATALVVGCHVFLVVRVLLRTKLALSSGPHSPPAAVMVVASACTATTAGQEVSDALRAPMPERPQPLKRKESLRIAMLTTKTSAQNVIVSTALDGGRRRYAVRGVA